MPPGCGRVRFVDLVATFLEYTQQRLTERALAFAETQEAHVEDIVWDVGEMAGGLYEDGVCVFGADVTDVLRAAITGDRHAAFIVGRLLAHEVLHGRRPQAAGAVEEAVVETLARAQAPALWGAPLGVVPFGVYEPLVRWWRRLSEWLGIDPCEAAALLKHGHAHPTRTPEAEHERLLGRLVLARAGHAGGSLECASRLGAAVAASAGRVNGGGYARPRSPVRAAEAALATLVV